MSLRLDGLGVRFDAFHALRDLSLGLEPGQALAVVGESGSGKSTLAKALAGLVPFSGSATWDGQPIRSVPRSTVQMVFQDPYGALNPVRRVRHPVSRALALHNRPETVEQLLERVGLDAAFADRFPHELSGGQRQRVNVARALAPAPKLLLADEPTSALDVSSRMDILRLLDRLRREHDMALIFITHDLAAARWLCDRILVLYAGRMMEEGPSDALARSPQHPYTRVLLEAARHGSLEAELPVKPRTVDDPRQLPGCPFADRCPSRQAACEQLPEVRGEAHRVACHAPL